MYKAIFTRAATARRIAAARGNGENESMISLHWPVILVGVVALLAGHRIRADELYKTVDSNGQVTYSDHPLSGASQRISIEVTPANAQEAARLNRQQATSEAQMEQRARDAQRESNDQAQKAAQLAQQQQRCNAARSRYATFAAGGRLFKLDEQGNRVYYSDDEIEQQRIVTKAAMDAACNF